MLQLKNAWPKAEDFDLEAFMEEWAYKLIDKICQRSGEDAEIYNPSFEDHCDCTFTLRPHKPLEKSASLELLKLYISPSDMSIEIAELRVNQKGKGVGKLIALDVLSSFQRLGFKKFELDAQDMGPDFWPQLGFAPRVDRNLEARYRERFEMLKPYLSPLRAVMINRELKNFNSFSPLAFSKMTDAESIRALCEKGEFRKAFAVFGTHDEIERLPQSRHVVHYIIENMIDDSQYKLGNLLNSRISPDKFMMELNMDDDAGRGVFNNCYQKFMKRSAIASQTGPAQEIA